MLRRFIQFQNTFFPDMTIVGFHEQTLLKSNASSISPASRQINKGLSDVTSISPVNKVLSEVSKSVAHRSLLNLGSPVRMCITPFKSDTKKCNTKKRNTQSNRKPKRCHGKENRKPHQKPEWNDSIHDLTTYKRSPAELKHQKILHTSRYDSFAKSRLEQNGIDLEEVEATLNSILSPPPKMKVHGDEDIYSEKEANEEDGVSEEEDNAYAELMEQINRYEQISGKEISASPLDSESSLLKMCIRLVGHLASSEKDIRVARNDIANKDKLISQLNLKLNDCISSNDELCMRVEHLESSVIPTNSCSHSEPLIETTPLKVDSISRRHKLLMKWREQNR